MSIDRPGFILLEAEDNDNCPGLPLMTYQALDQPTEMTQVIIAGHHGLEGPHWVTGWQNDADSSPCPATTCRSLTPGSQVISIVRRQHWGIRIKPVSQDEEWSIESSTQFAEPWLLLSKESDIIADSKL